MATTFSKVILSGSTNGKNIKVVATSDPGTTIHTAISGTTNMDEIWIYAVNTHSIDVNLFIEFGGNSSPDDIINITLKAYQGMTLIIPGFILNNSLIVKAYASIANVIDINGYVNRITV